MKTGAIGRFYVSPHALDRYVERVRPRLPRAAALRELVAISSAAEKLRTFEDGDELWRGPNTGPAPRLLFLVAPQSEGRLPVIRTVPERKKQDSKRDNHRARKSEARRIAYRARHLADSPPGDA